MLSLLGSTPVCASALLFATSIDDNIILLPFRAWMMHDQALGYRPALGLQVHKYSGICRGLRPSLPTLRRVFDYVCSACRCPLPTGTVIAVLSRHIYRSTNSRAPSYFDGTRSSNAHSLRVVHVHDPSDRELHWQGVDTDQVMTGGQMINR